MDERQKEAKRRAEVMIAFSEGAKIQFQKWEGGPWRPASSPSWDWKGFDYRIKPEPRLPRTIYINEYQEGSPTVNEGGLSNIFSFEEDYSKSLASKGFIRRVKFVEVIEDEQV
jgi:hypothetical protein